VSNATQLPPLDPAPNLESSSVELQRQLGSRLNYAPVSQATALQGRAIAEVTVRAAAEHGYEGLLKPQQLSPRGGGLPPSPRQQGAGPQTGVLADHLSVKMVGHLNQLQAYMQRVLRSERARHTSEVGLLLRKTGRDLKGTYDAVQDSMNMLSNQVVDICSDMESAQKQLMEIQQKYRAVREEADVQNQYISELEAALDANGAGVSGTLKKYMEMVVAAKKEHEKSMKDAKKKEADLKTEVTRLRKALHEAKDELAHVSRGPAPHPLPEMSPSWTRRSAEKCKAVSSRCIDAPEDVDVIGGVMAVSDSKRGVPRTKQVRHLLTSPRVQFTGAWPSPRRVQHQAVTTAAAAASAPPASQETEDASMAPTDAVLPEDVAGSCSEKLDPAEEQMIEESQQLTVDEDNGDQALKRQLAEARKRAQRAEEKSERCKRLLDFSAKSIRLVKAIFTELHTNWRLQSAEDALTKGDSSSSAATELTEDLIQKAPAVLDKITELFIAAIPGMGDLTELIMALTNELQLAGSPLPEKLGGVMMAKPAASVVSCSDEDDVLPSLEASLMESTV